MISMANRFSQRMRGRRFEMFEKLISLLPRPVRILDVGGTNGFWEKAKCHGNRDFEITLLNLRAQEQRHDNIKPLAGDATDLNGFDDGSFDVVFSNSVIEHLFTLGNQLKMADEVRRVAPNYWVQTPNFWFPVEPHFHFVGWQWLPLGTRVAVLRRKRCGWRGPVPDVENARKAVAEVRLMTRSELKRAFPGARIETERFAGMVKSWIVVGGFEKLQETTGVSKPPEVAQENCN